MSSNYCDDQYTFDAKPTASYSIDEKATASYTVDEKTTASPTIDVTPCTEILAILTEDSIEILYETGVPMTVEGSF